jgi:branched-chain amino acid transport system permease protein
MVMFVQLILSGITIGFIYAIVALGFVLIYKATKVFNFAQGELVLIGTYLVVYQVSYMKLPILIALGTSLAISVILGFAIERLLLRPMIGQPLVAVIMVTVGLSSILKSAAALIWGLDDMVFVRFFPERPVSLGTVSLPEVYIWITMITIGFLVLFMWFYRKSKYGLAMRCSASDQDRALLMGISVKLVFGVSWALASVVATMGGLFLANLVTVNYNLSFFALKAFPAAILGGLDSVKGVILGGLIIGVAESLAGGYIDPLLGGGVKETVAFLLLLVILVVRPYGFFGKEEIERV